MGELKSEIKIDIELFRIEFRFLLVCILIQFSIILIIDILELNVIYHQKIIYLYSTSHHLRLSYKYSQSYLLNYF